MFRTVTHLAEAPAVADLLGLVFDPQDINQWLVDDPAERQERMSRWFEILVRHAIGGAGRVVVAEDGSAAAVWLDRTGEATEPDDYEERLVKVAGPHLPRFQELDVLLEENHPAEPHWHLAFLVVHPSRQRRGIGSKLMQHTYGELPHPVYLEATTIESRTLYETRHGFERMTPAQIRTVGGPPFHRMWRPRL